MKLSDETMKRTVALPAAAAAALTSSVDLGGDRAGPLGHTLEVHLSLPALPSLVDAKTVTVDLYDCDTEDGVYAVVPTVGNMVVTGAGGAGAAAKSWRFYLPPDTRRFVKARAAVLTGGGDNTAKSLAMEFRV